MPPTDHGAGTPPPGGGAPGSPDGDHVQPLNIEEELKGSYLTYAMSVIISRALPDVRDGLKPSQRRILVAMNDLNLTPGSARAKCAKIVGETMGNYHPHGDMAIYPTLVRMAQEWSLRHVIIDKQGNFGSLAGLPPASMRYTEARMSPIALELLNDLERDTVDMVPSYDGRRQEPTVLPSRFPNLLVNGADGIAVGMATSIPPHNLGEVCDAVIRLIDAPNTSVEQLMDIVPGPDFPTGGIICGRQGIIDGYRTGRGKIVVRARAHINEEGSKTQIIITEIPFQQIRNRVMESIGEAIKDEKITGISGAPRDESSERRGEPVRIVCDLKREADPNLVLNQLYQFTPLQETQSIIMLALVDGRPRTLNLKQLLEEFIRHRVRVIRRRTEYLLREAKRRAHLLEGQLIAIASLDEVIQICRTSPSRAEAKVRLRQLAVSAAVMERALGAEGFASLQRELGTLPEYRMSEEQAEAVVRMQLGQLAALERDEIIKEYGELRKHIVAHEQLLSSEKNLLQVVRQDMVELKEKYGEERRTQIMEAAVGEVRFEDLIAEEINAVTISHHGYIKRLPLNTYRAQHRGGRGVTGAQTHEDDFIEHFFVASTHAYLLFFTNRGQVYWVKVYDLPQMSRQAAGRAIANVLSLKPEEKITSVIPVRRFDPSRCLLMATRRGLVKKTVLEAYSRPRAGGLIAISLEEGDSLIDTVLTQPGDEVVLSSKMGMAIRFDESDARPMGRDTRGVKGINLLEGDEVVGMVVADPQGYLLTVCENGYGKRTPFGPNTVGEEVEEGEEESGIGNQESGETSEPPAATEESGDTAPAAESREPTTAMRYRKQRRGGKGLRDIRTSERNGQVVCVISVRDGDELMLITQQGMVTRTRVDEVRVIGRNTQGVRLISLNEGDKVVTAAKIAQEDVDQPVDQAGDTPATEGPSPPPPDEPPAPPSDQPPE
jgi:DNA gyrase subunit A